MSLLAASRPNSKVRADTRGLDMMVEPVGVSDLLLPTQADKLNAMEALMAGSVIPQDQAGLEGDESGGRPGADNARRN